MNKEEIKTGYVGKFEGFDTTTPILLSEILSDLKEGKIEVQQAYDLIKKTKLENNTLTVEIPKGYKTLDHVEMSEGDRHYFKIKLQPESKMCKIRQPHDGIDCPCNREEKIEKGAKKFAEDFEGVMKDLSKE